MLVPGRVGVTPPGVPWELGGICRRSFPRRIIWFPEINDSRDFYCYLDKLVSMCPEWSLSLRLIRIRKLQEHRDGFACDLRCLIHQMEPGVRRSGGSVFASGSHWKSEDRESRAGKCVPGKAKKENRKKRNGIHSKKIETRATKTRSWRTQAGAWSCRATLASYVLLLRYSKSRFEIQT